MSEVKTYLKNFKCTLSLVKQSLINSRYIIKVRTGKEFKLNRSKYEILRHVHQLEKGMSINEPKVGFGVEKANQLLKLVKSVEEYSHLEDVRCIRDIGLSALESYIKLYSLKGWDTSRITTLIVEFGDLYPNLNSDLAGTIEIKKRIYDDNVFSSLVEIADGRHSIRDFNSDPVDVELILKAIKVAQRAPSACNRQAVKYYIIDKDHFNYLSEWLGDIGYFGEYGFDKLIIVTGVITGYNEYETYQHLVSPGIAVGYLTLALEALNIGACVMQRHIFFEPKWRKACEKLNIPKDEQCFCLIGCGRKKDVYHVPKSERMPTDCIARIIG